MLVAVWNISGDAALVAIGAGSAALIAAVTAQTRLRAQLRHDSEGREREATRGALNNVVGAIGDAAAPMNAAGAAFQEVFLARSAATSFGAADPLELQVAEAEAGAAVRRLHEQNVPLMTAAFQLHLRFPDTDPIIARLAEWRATYDELIADYEAALDSSDLEMKERFETADETATRLGKELNDFLTVARAWTSAP